MTARGLVACHYTLAGAAPPALSPISFEHRVAAAATAGFSAIGMVTWELRALKRAGGNARDLTRIVRDHGIAVDELELLTGWVGDTVDQERTSLLWELVEAFRPHHLIAGAPSLSGEVLDTQTAATRLGEACDRAAEFGVQVAIEFVPGTAVPDLATAEAIVRRADRANLGVLVDLLHFTRGGGTPAALETCSCPVTGVQLTDHGPPRPDVSHFDEWRYGGLPPGTGTLEVGRFVQVLDRVAPGIPFSVEVLSPELWSYGVDESARRVFEATRRVIASAGE